MDRAELIRQIANLFVEARRTHDASLGDTASDPDWALSYAQTMKPQVQKLLGRTSPCVELVRVILDAEEEHQTRSPNEPWQDFYASYLVNRCADSAEESLALYYYPSCWFCRRVMGTIEKLGVQIELRDILEEPRYRQELMAARGRTTVPVLRCTGKGHDRWMPESRDIMAYLERRFSR